MDDDRTRVGDCHQCHTTTHLPATHDICDTCHNTNRGNHRD